MFLPSALAAQTLADEELADVPVGHGERVLFVDDESALCTAAKHMLKRLGYTPHVFQDPLAAWQAFSDAPGSFDIVITDLTMPRRTGLELASEMLRLRPNLPVILSSGYSATLTQEMLDEMGIRELLYKPLDYRALAEALARALPGQLSRTA
jgi:DNA-binding NtrC family response regulator